MTELRGLAFLLLLQAAGEALVRALKLPFPGPVLGLILLLPALQFRVVREPVSKTAELLLSHLSLLFVPVGVGVITHLDLLETSGVQLLVAIVASTWVGMTVTALVLRAMLRSTAARSEQTRMPTNEPTGEASEPSVEQIGEQNVDPRGNKESGHG